MQNTIDKSVQRDVRAHLGWNAGELSQFVYDCGITYLAKYIPEYPQIAAEISASKIFWNWWKAHWEKRDLQFIEQIYGMEENREEKVELYKELHEPRSLAAAIYLNGQVLEESYAGMISKVTKSQTEKQVA